MTESIESAADFITRKKAEYGLDKPIQIKDIARKGSDFWIKRAGSFITQSHYPEKVLVLERLEWVGSEGSTAVEHSKGDVEYRIGYYIVGKNGRRQGKWTWGQYAPFVPADDFFRLLEQAKAEWTIKHGDRPHRTTT